MLGGVPWCLTADTRAYYALEQQTGKSYLYSVHRFLHRKFRRVEYILLMLYAFSATHRHENRIVMEGSPLPADFVAMVPFADIQAMEAICLSLLIDSGLAKMVPASEAAPKKKQSATPTLRQTGRVKS
jgi:hypothetical protein